MESGRALMSLGHIYENGEGVRINQGFAFTFYKKAADVDYPQGLFTLAKFHEVKLIFSLFICV
jgi:TPR repeat protein